jgi:ubiquinone biosynthesis UbiH/UbiF/VisC/COQ6 family hydroxylase
VPELAWIVDAQALEDVLDAAARFSPAVSLHTEPPLAALTLVAEGKASAERERLGAHMPVQAYGHSAVAARLVGEQAHAGVAHQWFRSPDILALLPFDQPALGHGWALVWSQPHEQAQQWLQVPAEEFEAALFDATGGAIGPLKLAGPRVAWPLAIGQAEPLCGPGWALLGDAAHLVHPLAGQGLNLGLADVMALADVLAQRESWRSLGDPALLARYARKRLFATRAMAGLTDGLWQLFAQSHPLARELRNRGLTLVEHLPPLKRWLMARAMKV